MKIYKSIKSLVLFFVPFLASCNSGDVPTPIPPEPTETYDITFKSNNEIVALYEDQVPGTFVDIPKIASLDDRFTLKGWAGISDKGFKEGKVKVYESDATYSAIWSESFGTETVFEAYSLKSTDEIVVDGEKDEAYLESQEIAIQDSSVDASAKAYVTWDIDDLYIFVEVKDSTYCPHKASWQYITAADSVAVYLDLLHNDSLSEENYTTGWGKKYRGEPGPMCEGWFKISAGASFPDEEENRYSVGDGSDFCFEGWLSYAARSEGNTIGTTKATESGYNVEYRIDLTNAAIPTELKPKASNEFGLGIVLFDQVDPNYSIDETASKKVGLESINLESEVGPKRLSNFVYKQNEDDTRIPFKAIEVRDGYHVSSEQEKDILYKDAAQLEEGGNTLEALFDENKLYLYASKGEDVDSLSIQFSNINEIFSITGERKIIVDRENTRFFTLTYEANGETVSKDYFIKYSDNVSNLDPARKIYSSKKLDGSITVDGELDSSYNALSKFDVNVKSLEEKPSLNATATTYTAWDNDYLYVFVDVIDNEVDSETINEFNPELNDSVELWISTTRVIPTSSTGWGDSNRPRPDYCGEGLFRSRAGINGEDGVTGFHWMYDNKQVCPREIATKLTENGYTVEYKIGWASFASEDKENQIIDIMICVNDGENNIRKGIVCSNKYGHQTYLKPYYMDHLQLVK